MNLSELKIGKSAIIHNVDGNEKLTKRLLALGFIEGTEIQMKRYAPLGDPMIINIRGFNLAIRKKDAKRITIEG